MSSRWGATSRKDTVNPRKTTLNDHDTHNLNDFSMKTSPSPPEALTMISSRDEEQQHPTSFTHDDNTCFTFDGVSVHVPNVVPSHPDPFTYTLDTSSPIYSSPLNIDTWALAEEKEFDMSAWLEKQQQPGIFQDQAAEPAAAAAAPFPEELGHLHPPLPIDEPMPWVVGLLGNILRQATELSSGQWDLEMMHMSWFDGNDPISIGGLKPLSPLEHSVALMVKFVLTLQMILPKDHSLDPPTLNLSTALMILSAYLKFIHLLDRMLSRVSRCIYEQQIRQQSVASSSSSGGDSGEDLASMWEPTIDPKAALQAGRACQVPTIIRMFEQQLRSMETLMGLPAEYRRWSRVSPDIDTPGIFSHHNASLLKAIIGQNQNSEGFQGHNQLSSVQETMERLKAGF
ncbi:hypothetical protein PENSTE_c001G06696 [Penicillium steckii]|uniref:Aflatoxin regulatory protein domain-containing protein n=1 Tax=Penicillium steckii TaxID=303698 RepID=A0A1V6U0E7_9EURO|nr:hypothetical protein PENSTE_c001G06696 [Penicillium steckii]